MLNFQNISQFRLNIHFSKFTFNYLHFEKYLIILHISSFPRQFPVNIYSQLPDPLPQGKLNKEVPRSWCNVWTCPYSRSDIAVNIWTSIKYANFEDTFSRSNVRSVLPMKSFSDMEFLNITLPNLHDGYTSNRTGLFSSWKLRIAEKV